MNHIEPYQYRNPLPYKQRVGGSNPSTPTWLSSTYKMKLVSAFLLVYILAYTSL